MNKIKILQDIVANKIAAGEVIERPASVVKELVENAVDAGADSIAVEVENGGRRLIRVSDNGVGMSSDDALLSIERHATSKIESVSDIETILTLGFRGEALPSIVSVSRTTINTRTKEERFGTQLVIDGGVLRDVTEIGRDEGTDVEVKNLFFNLPARRKFLKTESTELKHIKSMLYDTVIANPGVSLSLISEGKEVFSFKKCSGRSEMIRQIFGDRLAARMIPLKIQADRIEIEGFFAKPETASTGFNQYIIVNGRPVKSKSIARAVLNGYGPSLAKGMYPAFTVYLEVEPQRVDVNIHPTKREIRIHRDFAVLQALKENISELLHSMGAMPDLSDYKSSFADFKHSGTPVTIYNPPAEKWYRDIPRTAKDSRHSASQPSQTGFSLPVSADESRLKKSTDITEAGGAIFEGPMFMQLDDLYIVTTIKEGMIIIDQHVAHERILYEEILENFTGQQASAQQLLFPITLDFLPAEFEILTPMLPHLKKIGFGIREFGERAVMVEAIPAGISRFENGRILYEFIEEMRVHGKITSGYLDKLAAALACRAAIKAGHPLKQSEMQYLIDKLFATKSPFVCPHGRPTMVKLTLDELNRRFGR